MGKYKVLIARSAQKEIENLNDPLFSRVLKKIDQLVDLPRPSGYKKLVGVNNLWRVRVGDYRIIYSIDDKDECVDIIAVRHRKEAYE